MADLIKYFELYMGICMHIIVYIHLATYKNLIYYLKKKKHFQVIGAYSHTQTQIRNENLLTSRLPSLSLSGKVNDLQSLQLKTTNQINFIALPSHLFRKQ